MDVINKLYFTVSNTVSQISNALPGNAVTKEYDVYEHIGSAGPGLLWKVYNGSKKSTKQEASIFVFEKKNLEKWPKDERDAMLDILKRSVVQLTKIRHPKVLTVQHPLEESRDSIAFATEPVFASLANILGDTQNLPHPAQQALSKHILYDVEIKYGLVQLTEGLAFLHSDAKILHRNVCPESVIINREGSWKIFGFDYSVLNQYGGGANEPNPYWPHQPYNATYHVLTQPSLEYMAPENVLHSKHSTASDIFSLGILIYTLHSVNHKPIKMFGKNVESFRKFGQDLQNGRFPNLSCIPAGLSDYVRLMINGNPEMRPSIYDISKISYFDDIAVKTLTYLDSSFQWNNLQKSKFYKSLPQILNELPHRINIQHILPSLTKEFVNPQMIPFVLPNYFLIAEKCTKEEYSLLHGHLKPVLRLQEPIQILLILIQNIELLLKLTPTEDLQTDVLPMLYRALETDTQAIQDMCLAILPAYAANVDYPTIKNGILPRIKNLCLTSQNAKMIQNSLVCTGKLLSYMDKWLVIDEVIPFLMKIKTRDPDVIMGILDVLNVIISSAKLGVTKDVIATKLIPFLMPLSIENNLSLPQFDAILSMIKEMVGQVEAEHRNKLEQLHSIQQVSRPAYENPLEKISIPPPPFQTAKVDAIAAWDAELESSQSKRIPPMKLTTTSPISSSSCVTTPNNNTKSLNQSLRAMNVSDVTMQSYQSQQPASVAAPQQSAVNYNPVSWNTPPLNGNGITFGPTSWTMNSAPKDFTSFGGGYAGVQQEKKSLLQLANAPTTTSKIAANKQPLLLQPMGNANGDRQSAGSASLSKQDILDFLS